MDSTWKGDRKFKDRHVGGKGIVRRGDQIEIVLFVTEREVLSLHNKFCSK